MSDNNEQKAKKEANRIYPLSGASEALDNQSKRFREAFLKGYKYAESENTALKLEVEKYREALERICKQNWSDNTNLFGADNTLAEYIKTAEQALKEN